jgi:hypothetical protein
MRLRHTTHARDAALGQLERANRWLVVGSVALTAVFAELASQAFPGHKTAGAKAKAQSRAARHPTSTAPLRPPAQPPARAAEPHVTEAEREERSQGEVEEPASPETAPAEPSQAPTESAPPPSEPESHAEAPVETHEAPAQETAPPVVSGGS